MLAGEGLSLRRSGSLGETLDGLPGVAVERYGDYLVAQLFSPALAAARSPPRKRAVSPAAPRSSSKSPDEAASSLAC